MKKRYKLTLNSENIKRLKILIKTDPYFKQFKSLSGYINYLLINRKTILFAKDKNK
jgi:hypothetical protein